MSSSKKLYIVFLAVALLMAGCQMGPKVKTESVRLYEQGRYGEAIPKAEADLAATEARLGPEDPQVAGRLNILALLYYSDGDYNRAEPLLQRALAIRDKNPGQDQLELATVLNNLGLVYDALGDYAKAAPLYRRSLDIREKVLGKDHPDVAASLNNLAGLYYALGDYVPAVPLYKRAVEIWEKTLGKDHPDLAASLGNLAGLYQSLGQPDRAEPLYLRALSIREKALGPDHPDVAASLNNLALLYQETGRLDKAEPLYRRAMAILEKTLGPDHPYVAAGLENLGALSAERGDFTGAEALYLRSLKIYEGVLGTRHPDVAASLNNLAGLYASHGDYRRAHDMFGRAQAIDAELIDQVLGFTSEEKKINFLATRQSSLEAYLSLTAQYLSGDTRAKQGAMNAWLGRKGIILEAQRRFQEALIDSDNPEASKAFKDLSQARADLSRLTFAGPGEEGPKAYRKKLSELENNKRELEARLARLSQSYALQQTMARADCAQVARALPAQSVLIDVARINMFDFKAGSRRDPWQPAHYLAFVLPAGRPEALGLVDLGEARKIDLAVVRLKKSVNDVSDPAGSAAIKAARELYDLVMAPLKKQVGTARELFVSPDGNLNLVPFEVFQGPEGRFLIQDIQLSYLSAGRDVAGFGKKTGQSGRGRALLVGDPDFDLSGKAKQTALTRLGLVSNRGLEADHGTADLRGLTFTPLPGTRDEVTAVQQILGPEQVELYTGSEALEEVLRQHNAPRLLHLATHGFFLTDGQFRQLAASRGSGAASRDIVFTDAKFPQSVNPLLRSGLALAGANRSISGRGASDGIFTAEKVLGLRLRGTDLVVLSACQTGLGEVMAGEGVYGLRRAFTQAGATGLVMSMWSVPDRETQELMVDFYQNLEKGGENRAEALRQAALTQMDRVKGRYGAANPFYWGAFVYLGQP